MSESDYERGKVKSTGRTTKRTARKTDSTKAGRTADTAQRRADRRTPAKEERKTRRSPAAEKRTSRRAGGERTVTRTTVRSADQASGRQNRRGAEIKVKKRSGGAGAVILVILILLVIAAIAFVVKDSFFSDASLKGSLLSELPFMNGSSRLIDQAEELTQAYDYDGAISLLKASDRYETDTKLQEKAQEIETAKAAMEDAVNSALASAEERALEFDYQGAADVLKASSYYTASAVLQEKAAAYEEAKKSGGDTQLVAEADRLAAMYDYDGAAELLKSAAGYQENAALQEKVSGYEAAKAACVAINPEEVTHIFYHSLVVDPSKAFNPHEAGYDGWQQWMTTVYEFDKITQSMYDRGYVLVSIYDLFEKTQAEDGTVTLTPQQIYLPEGKKAFVLSLDDLCYYHTYDNHGVASKIVLDENGKPTCEYIEDDGTVVYGAYDVVPRMDAFLEEHPDGCYRGARGTIALTGYNGILGYRTDGTYSAEHNTNSERYYTDSLQQEWLDEHPDFDWEQECEEAKRVVDAMKADGWTFASHTWGHKAVGDTGYDDLVADTERWMQYVSPLIGGTDAIIFAHGQDLSQTGTYDASNDKYNYLKSQGFDVFCNVDSTAYTTTVTSEYFHQGRRNLDGYRIYQDYISDSPLAGDLFNAAEVLDPERPLPVPEL
ncbi:MAG: polysaccharide deacetylase [Eubacteriales bacterium]|nr:polysaccharide deacetylase [Eubacteriales bacterium]